MKYLPWMVTLGGIVVACGGATESNANDASADAASTDAASTDASTPDAPKTADGSTCSGTTLSTCTAYPLSCNAQLASLTLATEMAPFLNVPPQDDCPTGASWVEKYESCGLVAIHAARPTEWSTHFFDLKSGGSVGGRSSDKTCYGTWDFPCDGVVICTHLCGSTETSGSPMLCGPKLADAGGQGG